LEKQLLREILELDKLQSRQIRTLAALGLPCCVTLRFMTDHYQHDAAIVQKIVARLPDVRAIYRYGSAGTKYERKVSDIDIAILASRIVPLQEMLELAGELTVLTGREIDLHDLRKLPVSLRVQIVLDGKRLYCKDRAAAEAYDSRTLSEYVRLNEERRYILNDIKRREQIYG